MQSRFSSKVAFALLFLGAIFCHGEEAASKMTETSPWRFEAGFAAGHPTPVNVVAGFGYKPVIFRAQGMGVRKGENHFWSGVRGTLAYTLFPKKNFSLDFGLGGGYEFAEAPNKKHQILNEVNDGKIVFPFNYKENGDLTVEVWTHVFGFFTQIGYPVYHFIKHDEPRFIWRIGYIIEY